MNQIKIVGIGPGSEEYLLPIAKEVIAEAEVLIGGERALDLFSGLDKEYLKITANLKRIKDYIKENFRERKIVVLVSGDPGLYSMLSYLKRYFAADKLEVIPGVSALQLACARGKMTWQDAEIISLHGSDRRQELLELVEQKSKVAFFTDQEFLPHEVADYLLASGVSAKEGLVAENLGYDSERVVSGTLTELSQQEFGSLSVMVIYDE
ncbi:MAG: precorrin-6y C5,15-methyltransferase (decarboxylating) subunit CbiE [Bacillota bacterium]